jgi:pre-rRNA-processing protein IPI3
MCVRLPAHMRRHAGALLTRSAQVALKSQVGQRITAVAASADGSLVAGGSATGQLLLWEVESGRLLGTADAHFKPVSALAFTDDAAFIVSGGQDALLSAWEPGALLPRAEPPRAFVEWSDHGLAVTAVHCCAGGAGARVVSASEDRTCRVWHVPSRTLLATLLFPSPIAAVVVDPEERRLFAAAADGCVYRVELDAATAAAAASSSSSSSSSAAAAAASAPSAPSAFGDLTLAKFAMAGHERAVLALALTHDGSRLVSGAADGTLRLWDARSGQLLKTMSKGRRAMHAVAVVLDAEGFFARPPRPGRPARDVARRTFSHLHKQVWTPGQPDAAAVVRLGKRPAPMWPRDVGPDEGEVARVVRRALGAARGGDETELEASASDETDQRSRERDLERRCAQLAAEAERWRAAATRLLSSDRTSGANAK